MPPYFTIITAIRNSANTLPRLLASLAEQTCRDFEWIAQDGASTDDTLVIIEAWRDKLPSVSVESAPDTGIYDAWNKALDRQGEGLGQWVLFLGADDRLISPDTLTNVYQKICSLQSTVLYAGGEQIYIDANNMPVASIGLRKNDIVTHLQDISLPNAALFYRKLLFEKHRFDTTYKFIGDYEFVCRTLYAEDTIIDLHMSITQMYRGGLTSSLRYIAPLRYEYIRLRKQHFMPLSFIQKWSILLKVSILQVLLALSGEKRVAKWLNIARARRGLPKIWGE